MLSQGLEKKGEDRRKGGVKTDIWREGVGEEKGTGKRRRGRGDRERGSGRGEKGEKGRKRKGEKGKERERDRYREREDRTEKIFLQDRTYGSFFS